MKILSWVGPALMIVGAGLIGYGQYTDGIQKTRLAALEESVDAVIEVHDAKCGPDAVVTRDDKFCDGVAEVGFKIIRLRDYAR